MGVDIESSVAGTTTLEREWGATSGTGTAYPSGAPEFTPSF
jgi:hypothetical protein